MTPTNNRQLPATLATALAVRYDYAAENGIDFEPFPTFLTGADTTDWFQAWTGNSELDGDDFRVFGQDGSGGYAAFWLIRPSRPLTEQPIVFLGSEERPVSSPATWATSCGYWRAASAPGKLPPRTSPTGPRALIGN